MRYRDFIRLPIGSKIDIADEFYNYAMVKALTESGRPIYSIMEKQFGGHFCLFEKEENVFDDNDKYKYKILIGCTHVGAVSFHTEGMFNQLSKLRIVPKSSYLKTFPAIFSDILTNN